MTLHTRVCDLFGVRWPIVQTGMGWVAGARLCAASSKAGALGMLASATMTLPQLRVAIAEVKSRTEAPFGVNLRADAPDAVERIQLLVDEKIKVASFAQAPTKDLITRLHDGGVLAIATVGQRRHAEKVAEMGIDAIIAQGHEGGGHTGPVPTTLLLPQVVDAVDVPVLGAGGFFDGRGLVAALSYGADGIAMGTRFLLTRESTVPDSVKQIYMGTHITGTVVTRAVDGVPQRVIATPFIERLESSSWLGRLVRAFWHAWQFRQLTGASFSALLKEGWAMRARLTLPQVMLAASAPMLTKAALVDGKPEVGILPTGQCAGAIEDLPSVAELIAAIVDEAEHTLLRLRGPSVERKSA